VPIKYVKEAWEKLYLAQEIDASLSRNTLSNKLRNNDNAVRGYFFVSFLSLYLYFGVLEKIRATGMIGEVSVEELLFKLSSVYLIKYRSGKERLSEVSSKVQKLMTKLNLDLLPKN
jgi:hypothetical protein